MKDKLTQEHIAALSEYERFFKTALEARWCSYPGQAALDKMRNIWAEVTGVTYPFRSGCSACILNLVRDIGRLYFAQKDSIAVAPPKTPVEAQTDPKARKTTAKKKSAPKTAKKTKK